MIIKSNFNHLSNTIHLDRGVMLLELLVSIGIFSVVFAYAVQSLMGSTERSFDTEIVIKTEEKARSILDLMLFDLRMIGTGIPFDQSDFKISSGGSLGSAALPVITDSTENYLHFRINELGKDTTLTSSFEPDSTSTFGVYSVEDLLEGDLIYLSDETTGGSDGLQGTIGSISGTNVTLLNNFIFSDGATFPVGSLLNRVTTIIYDSTDNDEGITRDNGFGATVLSPNSSFTISYLDALDNEISTPLSSDDIESNLTTIEVTVSVISERTLKNGSSYTAQSSSRVTVRSL